MYSYLLPFPCFPPLPPPLSLSSLLSSLPLLSLHVCLCVIFPQPLADSLTRCTPQPFCFLVCCVESLLSASCSLYVTLVIISIYIYIYISQYFHFITCNLVHSIAYSWVLLLSSLRQSWVHHNYTANICWSFRTNVCRWLWTLNSPACRSLFLMPHCHRIVQRVARNKKRSWEAVLSHLGAMLGHVAASWPDVGSKNMFFWLSWWMLWHLGAKMAHNSAKTRQDRRTQAPELRNLAPRWT